jgi:two-component system, NtrC family, response regulator HydG
MQDQTPTSRAGDSSTPRLRTGASRILVVDDEPDTCELLCRILEGEGYWAVAETTGRAALARLTSQTFDLVLTDVCMDEVDGLDLCRQVVETRPEVPVILMTGQGSMNTVIAALRLGARDFLMKPLDVPSLMASLDKALRQCSAQAESAPARVSTVPAPDPGLPVLMGKSEAIRRVHEMVTDLSQSVATILLQGETGTGKEIIARGIHRTSRFSAGPFVALNCAAVPGGLLESELFGHARGAFTDAKAAKKGLLFQANGGTLLLDEIGELPLEMQPKLLRALQERQVRPIGEDREIPFDCRVIAATNHDLGLEVSEKRFREDLYYRLDVVRITLPPLRERGDDILLLARHFLERFARSSNRRLTLSVAVEQKLLAYSWPGNVRELENCIDRAVALARFAELKVDDLPEKIREPEANYRETAKDPDVVSLFEIERRHVLEALARLGGNKTRAAELLGIHRRTLYRLLERYESSSN